MATIEHHSLPPLTPIEPPASLLERVLDAVMRARIRMLRFRFVSVLIGAIGTILLIGLNVSWLVSEAQGSSFVGFLRLIVSDPDVVFAHATDFGWSLLESLPVATVVVTLTGIFFLLAAFGFGQAFLRARRNVALHHPTHSSI